MNGPRKQKGIALVLVLWVLVLLTVIAGSMVMTQRSGAVMLGNIKQERQGRALVAAGINYMILKLEERNLPADQQEWPADGRLHPWVFDGHTVWIGAMPDSAHINLNMADERLLLNMLQSVGLAEDEATAIRDAIMDWRDGDSDHRLEGAEDDHYERDGRPLGARDANFLSVEELQQVLGVGPELYKKLQPLLTVHSRQRSVNPAFADSGVLLSVPGMTPESVEGYLAEREQALLQGTSVPLPVEGQESYYAKSAGSVYRVFAEIDSADGKTIEGEVILDLKARTQKGYQILEKNYSPLTTLGRVAQTTE